MEVIKNAELKTTAIETNKQDFSKNEELVKRQNIKDTPFTMISIDGEHFGVMGDYRITEKYMDKKKLERDLKKVTWNRITQIYMILEEEKERVKNEKTKKTNKK